jgi:hypothetical protein
LLAVIARNTTLATEETTEIFTRGADEHVMCTAAAIWWLYCRALPRKNVFQEVRQNHCRNGADENMIARRALRHRPCVLGRQKGK